MIKSMFFALCIAMVGCSTIEGMGKDIQKAGEKIQDAANR